MPLEKHDGERDDKDEEDDREQSKEETKSVNDQLIRPIDARNRWSLVIAQHSLDTGVLFLLLRRRGKLPIATGESEGLNHRVGTTHLVDLYKVK